MIGAALGIRIPRKDVGKVSNTSKNQPKRVGSKVANSSADSSKPLPSEDAWDY